MPVWLLVILVVLWISVPAIGLALGARELMRQDREEREMRDE